MRNAFLIGRDVYLRPFESADLPLVQGWANDPEIRALTGEVLPMGEAGASEFMERVRTDRDRVWFAVVLKERDKVIGEAGLLRMFHAWRATDLTIILGDRSAWGRGYGTQAIHLLLDFAFGYLSLHRVSLGVVGFNERALRFYESVGFRREGVQRDGYFYDGRYHDFIMMSLLAEEYRAASPRQGPVDAGSAC